MDPSTASTRRRMPGSRRLALLGSVAVIGMAMLVVGPGSWSGISFLSSVRAAEASQHPVGFADLVAKVRPAVISVRVNIEQSAVVEKAPLVSPFPHFFQFQFPSVPHPQEKIVGEGSGFFISADGYAVTNNHVVDNAESVQVTTDDGSIYKARVVGKDAKTDLAVIKVDAQKTFPYVKFADHEPRIGSWVVAVGNPYGLGGTVTAGVVSAEGRNIDAGPYDYMQIDAPINKGNSGGPTFDMDGNVIGVNTAIYSPSGGSIGIGFDVPAGTAKAVVAQLRENGHVTRGWMGVVMQSVTPGIAESLGMKKVEGAIVDETQPDSPAAKAGIKAGDVITAFNGAPVKDSRELAREAGQAAPGSAVDLAFLRDGQTKTVMLTLGRTPAQKTASAEGSQSTEPTPRLGLSLAPAREVAGAGQKGVAVLRVAPDSPAANNGLESGDLILDVGGQPVANPSDVSNAVAAAQSHGRHAVLMRVKTPQGTGFVALPIEKKAT